MNLVAAIAALNARIDQLKAEIASMSSFDPQVVANLTAKVDALQNAQQSLQAQVSDLVAAQQSVSGVMAASASDVSAKIDALTQRVATLETGVGDLSQLPTV